MSETIYAENYARICDSLPPGVRLLPVSKTVAAEKLISGWPALRAAGCQTLAENRVQEAHAKSTAFSEAFGDHAPRLAVIGPLQTNKAGQLVECAQEFQAVDRPKVAAALEHRLAAADRTLEVLVQVNTSGEAQKSGLPLSEAPDFIRSFAQYPHLKLRGLMTIAMLRDGTNDTAVRQCFADLRTLRDSLLSSVPDCVELHELSMGMSGDYDLAVAEGATTVRVGRAIFGERNYK